VIFYLVTREHGYTIRPYVEGWERMRLVPWDELFVKRQCDGGTYVFTDLDRLTASERGLAVSIWRQLAAHAPAVRLLNDPARVPARYELLRTLARAGVNRYRAWLASEELDGVRFPVFIRVANEHTGSLTPLLHTRAEIGRALRWARLQGYRPDDLLVVEFCDTADGDGVYRKYSAFVVGGDVLPRHLFMSRRWLIKKPDLDGDAFAAERDAYLWGNPHAERLLAICRELGIDYGRVDYSMLGDEPQVWEINTNPTILQLAERLTAAFERIDVASDSAPAIPITLDAGLLAARDREAAEARRLRRRREIVERLYALGLTRPVRVVARALGLR
jgi:hypothetical protein